MYRVLSDRARSLCRLGALKVVGVALSAAILAALLTVALRAQTSHSITVAWTYTQGTDLAIGFNVLRSTVTGGPYTQINSTVLPLTTLQYIDTLGVGGTTYFYVVNAQGASGDLSANSAQVSATFLGNPSIPAGITATAK